MVEDEKLDVQFSSSFFVFPGLPFKEKAPENQINEVRLPSSDNGSSGPCPDFVVWDAIWR